MTDSATRAFSVRDAPDAARHPAGVPVLFFTEMWERFSYYGMRALLVLYLVGPLDYARADALALYGTYTGLVYLTPIFGGWLADRYLGYRKAMLLALTQFVLQQQKLGTAGLPAGKEKLDARDWFQVALISALMVPLVYGVIAAWGAFGAIWSGLGTPIKIAVPVAAFIGFLAWQRRSCSREEWHRVLAIAVIGVFVIFFWMGFDQAGGPMNLFPDPPTEPLPFCCQRPAPILPAPHPLPTS